MFRDFTGELNKTIGMLESISRRLVLLKECVIENKDYLNPHDLTVYRGILDELQRDTDTLKIVDKSIQCLVKGCSKILDDMESLVEFGDTCHISCKGEGVITDDIDTRLEFQLKSLYATRGVKVYLLDKESIIGQKAISLLRDMNDDDIRVINYNDQQTKFTIELNLNTNIIE